MNCFIEKERLSSLPPPKPSPTGKLYGEGGELK